MTLIVLLLAVAIVVAFLVVRRRRRRFAPRQSISVRGIRRSFVLHDFSSNQKVPLLFCFHGGLGNADRIARQTGLVHIAARHGFAVVFPEAPGGWIDSRPERGGSPRDLEFIEALVEFLMESGKYDAGRVFGMGVSNGGLFVFRLALERPKLFTGLAAVLACLPVETRRKAKPGPAVPMALLYGRRDRLMPWTGGSIARGPGLGVGGEVVSAEETLEFWLDRNQAKAIATVQRITSGKHIVEIRDHPAGTGGCPVRFVAIEEWGHRWPRWGRQTGGQNGFNAAELILEFFSKQAVHARSRPVTGVSGDDHAVPRQHHL